MLDPNETLDQSKPTEFVPSVPNLGLSGAEQQATGQSNAISEEDLRFRGRQHMGESVRTPENLPKAERAARLEQAASIRKYLQENGDQLSARQRASLRDQFDKLLTENRRSREIETDLGYDSKYLSVSPREFLAANPDKYTDIESFIADWEDYLELKKDLRDVVGSEMPRTPGEILNPRSVNSFLGTVGNVLLAAKQNDIAHKSDLWPEEATVEIIGLAKELQEVLNRLSDAINGANEEAVAQMKARLDELLPKNAS